MTFKIGNHLRSFTFLLLLLSVNLLNANVSSKAPTAFHDISLPTAKELASDQNKYIFVEFYADWCVPCKWMEETTFADHSVQNKLQENFIALRVDIDDFDGFALKQIYDIRVLPTIMILDEKGRAIERQEQSLSAEMLLQLLNDTPEISREVPLNSAPSATIAEEEAGDIKLNETSSEVEDKINNHATVKTTSYRVQVGVYTDYANTQKMVQQLRSFTDEPIIVLNDYLNDRVVFKILVGDFDSKEEASKFKNQLWQNYGIDGFVK